LYTKETKETKKFGRYGSNAQPENGGSALLRRPNGPAAIVQKSMAKLSRNL
jgi:hypothetical protein